MGRLLDRRSPNRWRWVLAVALLELACPIQAGAARDGQAQVAVVQDTQSQVLVLYSTRRDAEIATIVDRELPKVLAPGVQGRLDFYSEYIDLSRFPDPLYQAGFRDFLHLKYAGRRFDLIVAVQDVAVEFLARNRSELFPGVPLVFLANGRPRQRPENATGLIATLSFGGTLDLALALQPAVRHVFIVSGASARDKVYETAARAQLQRFSPSVTLTYLAGLPTKDLEARLAKLPANSIVYYLLVY